MKEETKRYSSINEVPDDAWKNLSKVKIYFGHQSVGFDIIKGMQELINEYPFIKLYISENLKDIKSRSGIFLHSAVGKNFDPLSKIRDFQRILSRDIGNSVDIAGFKFCYVDIQNTDSNEEILKYYIRSMEEIKKEFPDLKIVHFTVPLMSIRVNWKDKIKKIIGIKIDDNSAENIARNKYNEMLRKSLGGQDVLFDLAAVESTYPNGSRCTFVRDGKTYFAMVPEYTYDGGHLTETGRKKVAEQFLLFLVSIL